MSVRFIGPTAQDEGASPANPAAKVGLTVVNGTASTFMRSDAAPPIDQSISPTWTALHTFKNNAELIALTTTSARGSGNAYLQYNDPTGVKGFVGYISGTTDNFYVANQLNANLILRTNGADAVTIVPGGNITFVGAIGVNNSSPPAQSTGWGTPTGGSVQNNFSGSAASLLTLGPAVAQIISVLQAVGFLGT